MEQNNQNSRKKAYILGSLNNEGFWGDVVRFELARKKLLRLGCKPVVPLDVYGSKNEIRQQRIQMMLDCDFVYLLKGFQSDDDSVFLLSVAKHTGMAIKHEGDE